MSLKRTTIVSGTLFLGAWFALYGCATISPLAFHPEPPLALEGNLAPNEELAAAFPLIQHEDLQGPETIAIDPEEPHFLYAGTQDGIVRIDSRIPSEIVDIFPTEGRALGMEFGPDGYLYIANHGIGLQRMSREGILDTLLSEAGGEPILFADDLDVGPDGVVYLTDASSRFNNTTMDSGPPYSPLDAFEARPHGRLISYDPATGGHEVISAGLYFANGVSLAHDGQSVLVVETSRYRISRHYISGPNEGQSDIFLDRLPGFADGLWPDPDGGYWLTFQTSRSEILDETLHPNPFLKRIVAALPRAVYANEPAYGLIVHLDDNGQVSASYHDPSASVAGIASLVRRDNELLMGTLVQDVIWRLPLE